MKNDAVAEKSITAAVEEHYAAVARGEASPCGAPVADVAKSIGYSEEELAIAGDANLGLGCGNPQAITALRVGETVLNLGRGGGQVPTRQRPRDGLDAGGGFEPARPAP